MKKKFKCDLLKELSKNQLANINGGSELTDWILQKLGWIAHFRADQREYENEFSYLYAHMD